MGKPFTPVYRDGKSAAALIAELVEGKPYGYLLTFEEIAGQLGIGPDELSRIRSAMARAKGRMLQEPVLRAVEARPGKGYVIVPPGEGVRLAAAHRRKSDRSIKRAIKVIRGVDERDMTDGERERNRQTGIALQLLQDRVKATEGEMARFRALMGGGGRKAIEGPPVAMPLAIDIGGKLAGLRTAAEIHEQDMRDPEYRREYERSQREREDGGESAAGAG